MAIENELYFDKLNFDPSTADVRGTGDKLLTDDGATANDLELTGTAVVPTGSNLTITDAPVAGTDAVNKDYVDGLISPTAPYWVKITKAYTDFSAAALTETIELYSLPAKYVISGVKIKHSVQFAGPSLGSATVKVGITGALTRLSKAFSVFAAVAATTLKTVNTQICFDEGSATSIKLTLDTTVCNIDDLTAGSVDVWLLISNPDA